MSFNYPIPEITYPDYSVPFNNKLIFCLRCGKFLRIGEAHEDPYTDPDRRASRWFCSKECLYIYAIKSGMDVKPHKLPIRDISSILTAVKGSEEVIKEK